MSALAPHAPSRAAYFAAVHAVVQGGEDEVVRDREPAIRPRLVVQLPRRLQALALAQAGWRGAVADVEADGADPLRVGARLLQVLAHAHLQAVAAPAARAAAAAAGLGVRRLLPATVRASGAVGAGRALGRTGKSGTTCRTCRVPGAPGSCIRAWWGGSRARTAAAPQSAAGCSRAPANIFLWRRSCQLAAPPRAPETGLYCCPSRSLIKFGPSIALFFSPAREAVGVAVGGFVRLRYLPSEHKDKKGMGRIRRSIEL